LCFQSNIFRANPQPYFHASPIGKRHHSFLFAALSLEKHPQKTAYDNESSSWTTLDEKASWNFRACRGTHRFAAATAVRLPLRHEEPFQFYIAAQSTGVSAYWRGGIGRRLLNKLRGHQPRLARRDSLRLPGAGVGDRTGWACFIIPTQISMRARSSRCRRRGGQRVSFAILPRGNRGNSRRARSCKNTVPFTGFPVSIVRRPVSRKVGGFRRKGRSRLRSYDI